MKRFLARSAVETLHSPCGLLQAETAGKLRAEAEQRLEEEAQSSAGAQTVEHWKGT